MDSEKYATKRSWSRAVEENGISSPLTAIVSGGRQDIPHGLAGYSPHCPPQAGRPGNQSKSLVAWVINTFLFLWFDIRRHPDALRDPSRIRRDARVQHGQSAVSGQSAEGAAVRQRDGVGHSLAALCAIDPDIPHPSGQRQRRDIAHLPAGE